MTFCSVTDPALSTNVVSTLPENTMLLYPPIQFGRQSYYEMRTASHFAIPCKFKLSFTQRFFLFERDVFVK